MEKVDIRFVCERFDIEQETLLNWVRCRLIQPADLNGPYFDEEDLGRIRLIAELNESYEANEELLELIMNLVDQIHSLTAGIKEAQTSENTINFPGSDTRQ